jgi:3',5'-cyclic AMP phosphodiesterase CpdA
MRVKKIAVVVLALIALLSFAGFIWSTQSGPAESVLTNAFQRIQVKAEKGPVRIAVFGDVRSNAAVLEEIIKGIEDDGKYDFAICTGDMVKNPTEADYRLFCDESLEELRETPLLFVPGNHDVDTDVSHPTAMYEKYFGEPYYSFSMGGALFVVIDNTVIPMDEKQYSWLKNLLATERSKYGALVVFMHSPPIDLRGGGAWHAMDKAEGAALLELLKQYNTSAIFCSHIHSFYEWEWNGIPIWVSGGGGASQDEDKPPLYHYLEVSVSGDKVTATLHAVPQPNTLGEKTEYVLKTTMRPYYLPIGAALAVAAALLGFLVKGKRHNGKQI